MGVNTTRILLAAVLAGPGVAHGPIFFFPDDKEGQRLSEDAFIRDFAGELPMGVRDQWLWAIEASEWASFLRGVVEVLARMHRPASERCCIARSWTRCELAR